MASEKIERLRAETKRLVDARQWDELISVVTELIKLEKEPEKWAEAYFWRGIAHYKKSDPDRAIEDFNSALNINPEYAEAYLGRGSAYSQKRDFDRAIKDFDKVLDINPEYAEAYIHRGSAYYEKRDVDRAIEDFDSVLKISPEFAEAYYSRGIAYIKKRDFDRAIEDFDRALDINPEYAEAYFSRGLAYDKNGDFDRANEDFDNALNINPQYAEACISHGLDHLEKGAPDSAIKYFEKAQKAGYETMSMRNGMFYCYLGVAHLRMDNYHPAMINLNRAAQYSNDLKYIHRFVYIASQISVIDHLKDNDKVKAFENYSKLLKIVLKIQETLFYKKQNQVAHYTSLNVLKSLSENKGEFRFYNAAYMNDPEEGQVFFNMVKEKQDIDIKQCFYGNEEQPYRSPAYIGSFAEVQKDEPKDKLFLWRTYGKQDAEEAAGACLIFNSNCFSDWPDLQFGGMFQLQLHHSSGILQTQPKLYEIAYKEGKHCKAIEKEQLPELISRLKEIKEFIDKQDKETKELRQRARESLDSIHLKEIKELIDKRDEETEKLRQLARESLDSIRFLFKEKHYSGENEVRVVRLRYGQGDESSNSDIKVDMENIPPRFYLPVLRYFRFNEVILGPRTQHSQEWQQWLEEQGIDNVKRSEINYGKPYT